MQKFSVMYEVTFTKHFYIHASSEEECNKKLAEVSRLEELPNSKSHQLSDGSVIEIEILDCDSLDLDDFDIEEMED